MAPDPRSWDLAPCFCDACPSFPKIKEGFDPLNTLSGLQQFQSDVGTLPAEQLDRFLTNLCPVLSILECVDANSVCSSVHGDGNAPVGLPTIRSQCEAASKPTSYTTSYSFTSPNGCAGGKTESGSGAVGLLQLNLLAGAFFLLSILN
jgi:hypothetical protein